MSLISPIRVSFLYIIRSLLILLFFFFNDTATTEIYTLSLHDALPICGLRAPALQRHGHAVQHEAAAVPHQPRRRGRPGDERSEEHTSELQSPCNLVCRLLLEKKKKKDHHTLKKRPTVKKDIELQHQQL